MTVIFSVLEVDSFPAAEFLDVQILELLILIKIGFARVLAVIVEPLFVVLTSIMTGLKINRHTTIPAQPLPGSVILVPDIVSHITPSEDQASKLSKPHLN